MHIILFALVTLLTKAEYNEIYLDLITSGKCIYPIGSIDECSRASYSYEEVTTMSAKDDKQKYKDYDPEGCYFEKGKLKWNKPNRSYSNTGDCSKKDMCLCHQPDHWNTGAIVAGKDACGTPINEDNKFQGNLVQGRQIVFSTTKEENSIKKKCEYFSKHNPADLMYPFKGDRYMFNCDKTPDVCKSGPFQLFDLQKLPQVCNMMGGWWGDCRNRDKTPAKKSLEQLRNGLDYVNYPPNTIVHDLLNIADLDEYWPTELQNIDNTEVHRNWWNFHHLASFKQNPLYFDALNRFMNPDYGMLSYFCDTCKAHYTDELDKNMSEEAKSNVVMALWYLHNQAQWEITSGKQSDNPGPDDGRHQEWTYMPTDSECPECKTPNGWDYIKVQQHLYKEYDQESSCASEESKSDCEDRQNCKWNTYWGVCQQKAAKEGFAVLTQDNCRERIRSKSECEEAAEILEFDDTRVQSNNDSNDPPGCFYEKGDLKFNSGSNTGKCKRSDICLCRATKSLRAEPEKSGGLPEPFEPYGKASSSRQNERLRKTNQVLQKVLEALK